MTPELSKPALEPGMPLLKLENIHAGYGGVEVLKGIGLELYEGEIRTLIGSSGSGKSTTLMVISGLLPYRRGKVVYRDALLAGRSPEDIVRAGLCQVPEGQRIFPAFTVAENLAMGAYVRRDRIAVAHDLEMVYELFPLLARHRQKPGGLLPDYGRRMLALGRALMSRPRVLLLDEPVQGLAPLLAEKIFAIIEKIAGEGITILLVEQNSHAALNLADYGYVMEEGKIVFAAPAAELLRNEQVRRIYLDE